MSIDLHIHTNFSDGTDSPQEIVEKSEKLGLKGIAITDHETIKGLLTITKDTIEVVKGVEISAKWGALSEKNPESGIHILMYFVEEESNINMLLEEVRESKKSRNIQILEKLRMLDIHVDLDEIETHNDQVLGRPHIAELMVQHEYVTNITEAFNRYLGNGKPAHADLHQVSITKLMEVAKASKVVTVLAHPHTLNPKKNMLVNNNWIDTGLTTNLKELMSMGLTGIETYYSSYDLSIRKQLSKFANELNLIETGGSDYHGEIKLGLHLGTGWENKPLDVPDKFLDKLKEKYESIK
jgi:predicted metal-dependent phosphoesterase TrpH